jgi:hypothetical protein
MPTRERRAGWQPLLPATLKPLGPGELERRVAHALRVFPQISAAEVRAAIHDSIEGWQVWKNNRYQVHTRPIPGADMVHLSIRRLDREPIRDWRDLQRIKNQLVGPECEAFELFPAESRLVDGANQFHLFAVTDPTFRFPFGFDSGRWVTSESGAGAVQRPYGTA